MKESKDVAFRMSRRACEARWAMLEDALMESRIGGLGGEEGTMVERHTTGVSVMKV